MYVRMYLCIQCNACVLHAFEWEQKYVDLRCTMYMYVRTYCVVWKFGNYMYVYTYICFVHVFGEFAGK